MSSEERQATIMKWGIGAVIVTGLILFVVFVLVPLFSNKSNEEDEKEDEQDKVITLSGGNILSAELPSGGKTSEPYTMYKREFYSSITDSDKIAEAIENNKFIHLSITLSIPDQFNLSKYFKIKRILPNPQDVPATTEIDERTVIEYTIDNDSAFDTNNAVSSGMTIHRGDVDAKDIISDPNTGRITQASEFFKEESVEGETFKVFMWGESCGNNLQTSGLPETDQNSKNVIELFGKIDPKHYGTRTETEEIPIRNINLEPLRGEVLMPDSLYSRNLSSIDSSVVDIQMVGANNIELEKLTSEIIADDVKFYLGFKQSGKGRIDYNQWLKIPGDSPTGTFSARSLYSSKNTSDSAMDYFDSDQTPIFMFKNIESGDRTKFKIAFERGGTTYYMTHDIVDASDTTNTERKLKYTNVEADGKFFNLIETPNSSLREGSFKLVLDDFHLASNSRFVLCLDEKVAIDSFNELTNAIKILHSSAITPVQGLRQFAVYCPIVNNLAEGNKVFNIHILDNGPYNSQNFSKFSALSTSVGHINQPTSNKSVSGFGNVVQVDRNTTSAFQTISGMNITNNNYRFKFEQYSSGSHTYKLRSTTSNPKYLIGKNNQQPALDDIYFDDEPEDAAEVLIVGYPTTAALGISLKKEQTQTHCIVLYRKPGLEYRPIHHPNNTRKNIDPNYETKRARGGTNIQVLLKQIS